MNRSRAASLSLVLLAGVGRLLAAQQWVPPQPPCDIRPGHFRVTTGEVDLKLAAEKPEQRDRMLAQAKDVLVRAIGGDNQDKNAAAWYYLGRYFNETGDAVGADTAFARAEALAPQCKADIVNYRRALAAATHSKGAAAWQAGHKDSAAVAFHLAYRVFPSDARPLFALAANRRDALNNVARIYLSRVQSNPAAQRGQQIRARLDSLGRALAADSTVLDRMVASSASRHKRGAHLAPADQQTFTRDSSTHTEALARERAARAALAQQAADAAAALRALAAPAIQAYRDVMGAYPDDVDAASNLATLYGQSGEPEKASAVFDSLLGHASHTQADELIIAGQRLLGTGLLRPGTRALALGLNENPYARDALYYLATAYYSLRDSANTLATAQRLVALDPLNRNSLRLVAAGWDLKGRRDSTLKYLARADSGLAVDITVSSFAPDSSGFILTAIATNLKPGPSPSQPLQLVFEFLGPGGQVAATLPTLVPALAPGGSQEFELHVKGKNLLGWRYRPS